MALHEMVDAKVEAARITGAATVFTLWGMTATDWAAILAGLYSLINIIILLPKFFAVMGRAYENVRRRFGYPTDKP